MLKKFFNPGCKNKFATKIAALGLPSLILLFAIAITNDNVAITAALTFLNGSTEILGGIAFLIVIGLLTDNYLKCKPKQIIINKYKCHQEYKSHLSENIIRKIIAILEKVLGTTSARATVVETNATDISLDAIAILENVPALAHITEILIVPNRLCDSEMVQL